MAFIHLNTRACFFLSAKFLCVICPIQRLPKKTSLSSIAFTRRFLALSPFRKTSNDATKTLSLNFDSSSVTQFAVTEEIHFYRHCGNQFTQMSFSDPKEPYGPPLVIILPWSGLSEALLKKFIEFYGEKGFDIVIVSLKKEQLMYPCTVGHAMNVVSDLLQYLTDTHKHRPYIFHGFSIGVYVFGEIMAQFADHYETYREISSNIKGCLWDSPVDFLTAKPHIGKFLYPKNYIQRWRCNGAVRGHFKKHHHDSVAYWLRSRDSFCNPIIKVPNLFFVSYTDLLSNPNSLQCVQKVLEGNGIPIFQKTWWDSPHSQHFEKYCYEYMYGMILFFNLANFYPDECGKYRTSYAAASLTNLRLRKKARDNFS